MLNIPDIRREPHKYKQQLLLACHVTELLSPLKLVPVLVGGATVEFYTLGSYQTADIDMVLPGGDLEMIRETMEKAGFKRESDNRHWYHPDLPIPIEFPPSPVQIGDLFIENINQIYVEGHRLHILRLEDIVLDRVVAAQEWKSEEMGLQAEAIMLVNYSKMDWSYLHKAAHQTKALETLQRLQGSVKKTIESLK